MSELWEYANLYLNGIPTYRARQKRTGIAPRRVAELCLDMMARVGEPANARTIHLTEWGNGAFREVIGQFRDAFSGLSGTLVLMGSLADNTATGYSDLDAVYFPPDEEFAGSPEKIRRALVKAGRVILSFDHLQHHGVFILPESIARKRSPLPASALQGAVLLSGKTEIILGGWENSWKTNLFPILNKCEKLARNPRARPKSLYGIKLLLSQIMLLPSLFLLAMGKDVSKARSFSLVREMLRDDLPALDLATKLRASWKRPCSRAFKAGLALSPSPWDFAFAFRRFFRPPAETWLALDTGFYEDAGRLARRMRDALEG